MKYVEQTVCYLLAYHNTVDNYWNIFLNHIMHILIYGNQVLVQSAKLLVDLIIFHFFFFKCSWHNIKTFIQQITIYIYFKVRIIYLSTANKLGSLFRRLLHEHSSNREMKKKYIYILKRILVFISERHTNSKN